MKKLILIAFVISLLLPIQILSQMDNKKDRFSERLMQERFSRNIQPNAQINKGKVDNYIPDFRNTGNPYPHQIIFSPQSQTYVIDTAFVLQVEDGNLPAETSRHICSHNAGAKRTLELKQRLIDGSWMNDFCRTTTYDASNNMITDLWEWWETGQWINGYRHTYTYDTQGNMLTYSYELWDNNQWVHDYRHTYTYDTQGNMLTDLGESWENGQWTNSYRQTYTYDTQGNMLTDLGESWGNGQWIINYRATYTYDTQGNMLTNLGESWENGQWVNSSYCTYTYDTQGNMLTFLYEYWWNSQWNNSWLITFIYDSQGNKLTALLENWENGQWMNYELQTFAYDTQGNLTSFKLYAWFESYWIPANINNYSGWVMYDMAGNEYHFWGHNFNFVYKLIVTGIQSESTNVPEHYSLSQNYPNPFNPTTTLSYQIPELSFVTLKVYDVLGNELATLINEQKPIGTYEVTFDASSLPSGVYFYQLKAGSFVETKKMVLMK